MNLLKSLRSSSLVRCELEPGSAKGRECDGESEGSRPGAGRVGSVGAEEEEALLPLGMGRGRGNGAAGMSERVVHPLVYLERTKQKVSIIK